MNPKLLPPTNIFAPVCHSVHRGKGGCGIEGVYRGDGGGGFDIERVV